MQPSINTPAIGLAAVAGRDDRFGELFVAHRLAVFRLAVLLAGNEHVAEEITAEVFAKVLQRWRRGDIDELLLYLRRAVVNEVRSRFRRHGHERRAMERLRARPTNNWAVDSGMRRGGCKPLPAWIRSSNFAPITAGAVGAWSER